MRILNLVSRHNKDNTTPQEKQTSSQEQVMEMLTHNSLVGGGPSERERERAEGT